MIQWRQLLFLGGRALCLWHPKEFLLTLQWLLCYVGCRDRKAAPQQCWGRRARPFPINCHHYWNFFLGAQNGFATLKNTEGGERAKRGKNAAAKLWFKLRLASADISTSACSTSGPDQTNRRFILSVRSFSIPFYASERACTCQSPKR